jgi:8-oxo-dGTP diphosphatase
MQVHRDEDKVKNEHGKTMKAGGVVVCDESGQKYVLLTHRTQFDDWTFPKGHIEKDESEENASAREIEEETGLKVLNGVKLPDIEYKNEANPRGVIVKMFLYKTDKKQLSCNDDESEPHWVPIEEVEEKLSYQNLKDYFRSVEDKIWKRNNQN